MATTMVATVIDAAVPQAFIGATPPAQTPSTPSVEQKPEGLSTTSTLTERAAHVVCGLQSTAFHQPSERAPSRATTTLDRTAPAFANPPNETKPEKSFDMRQMRNSGNGNTPLQAYAKQPPLAAINASNTSGEDKLRGSDLLQSDTPRRVYMTRQRSIAAASVAVSAPEAPQGDPVDLGNDAPNSQLESVAADAVQDGAEPEDAQQTEGGATSVKMEQDDEPEAMEQRPAKKYSCGHCNYRTSNKHHLKDHLRRHTGERPYRCNECDYCAADKRILVVHRRRHSGEKPYRCELCAFGATQQTDLTRHLRTHTGEKPYACHYENCDYQAARKGALNAHLRKHTR